MIYKNFWRRFLAVVIDHVLGFIVGFPLVMLAAVVGKKFGATGEQVISHEAQLTVILILLGMAYDILMTRKYGGTVGKLVMRVYITDLGGNPLGWGRATARLLAKLGHGAFSASMLTLTLVVELAQESSLLSLLGSSLRVLSLFLFPFFGYYFALFTKKRQALHDLMAGTLVVRKPKVKKDRDEGVAVTHP